VSTTSIVYLVNSKCMTPSGFAYPGTSCVLASVVNLESSLGPDTYIIYGESSPRLRPGLGVNYVCPLPLAWPFCMGQARDAHNVRRHDMMRM